MQRRNLASTSQQLLRPALGAAAAALWALLLATVPLAAQAAPGLLDVRVRLEPETRRLEAEAVLSAPGAGESLLVLDARYTVHALDIEGVPAPGPGEVGEGLRVWRLPAQSAGRRIHLSWSGELEPLDTELDHRQTLGAAAPVAGAEGAFLPAGSAWHPRLAGEPLGWRVEVDVPEGWRAVVPGRTVEEGVVEAEGATAGRWRGRFAFAGPGEAADLMAGPYVVERRLLPRAGGGEAVELSTWFHPELAPLAPAYLEAVSGYIQRYERLLGDYPFEAFAVVSSPTPTGFGMPGLTYLGRDVLKLPFIRETSLGHEVLHCWLGNGVYPDYARGNWSEGLTTFLADYAYKEDAGEAAAADMRLAWLRDFAAVPPGQDGPLAAFTARSHGTSQIVGYGKSAMLFYMLRERIGAEAFERGLKAFWAGWRSRTASWDDLRAAFEQSAGTSLAAFFEQWTTRAGAPTPRLVAAHAAETAAGWTLELDLAQGAPAWSLDLPLRIQTEAGPRWRSVGLDAAEARVRLELAERPLAVELDPALQVFRRLGPGEAPPILRDVMVDPATRVRFAGAEPAGAALAARLLEHPIAPLGEDAPTPAGPLLLVGLEAEVSAWLDRHGLPQAPREVAGRGEARVWTERLPDGATLVVVCAQGEAALQALQRPLPHYGRSSWLVLEQGRVVDKGAWPARAERLTLP